jgi:muconolactone delta-isomerase
MEYLVTMTTRVPDGTTQEAVDDIRARESTRSRELAAEGYLRRLWRPPLQPGEWRTLGLFAADDDVELEKALASMPLRVWRTDDVAPLLPHANDPTSRPPSPAGGSDRTAEFLTIFVLNIPQGTPSSVVDDTNAREAGRARQLAEQGHLLRLWKLTCAGRALGLWRATGMQEMDRILGSLPLRVWMTVETVPLTRHPSDPGL